MTVQSGKLSARMGSLAQVIRRGGAAFAHVPLLGWLLGVLAAVLLEQAGGLPFARVLGLGRIPPLFGFSIALRKPGLLPSALLYSILIYLVTTLLVAWLVAGLTNRVAGWMLKFPLVFSALVHTGLLYAGLHVWASVNDYRVLLLRLILIAVLTTVSLNVVNGYMGEFSCSHPGFLALGAYAASVVTVLAFVPDDVFGAPLLPPGLGPFMFPLALIIGGLVASIGALMVAIPSFRTRGDYLAIISLAFMFIVKSLIENLEIIGGPRGFMNQPDWANLPMVFAVTIVGIWVINNFVRSTVGKALNAVRDGELAADAMTVDTRKTKMTAFLFSAFWAGVAGGLFAHVMRYVNPGTFGVPKLAEVLAMVYFGGLNSIVGSVVGAVGYSLLSEMLRPLEIYKWIIIPTLLILVMIFRPTGLIAFREFDINEILKPKQKKDQEVAHAVASD